MRLIRGLAALLVLAGLAVGIPVALVLLGGLSLPQHLSWSGVAEALTRRDDGTLLVGLITLVAWAAWLVFAISLVVELVRVLSGFRVQIALPGLGGPQRLAAGLLLSVLTMLALPAASYADPGPAVAHAAPDLPVAAAATGTAQQLGQPRAAAEPQVIRAPTGASAATQSHAVTHRVQRGDDLWSLAEHYYGSGRDWRKIAAANPGLLTGGPDRLQPGWQLAIPGVDPTPRPSASVVTVRPGDSLTGIAERVYDDQHRWRDIFDANHSQIEDPDEIDAGQRLTIPAGDSGAMVQPESADSGGSGQRSSGRPLPKAPDSGQAKATVAPRAPEATTRTPGTTKPSTRTSGTTRPTTAAPSRPASSDPRSSTEASGQPTRTTTPSGQEQRAGSVGPSDSVLSAALGVGAVGGLLAASLLGGLALRRRVQLQARPVGRRLVHAAAPAQVVETALGRRQIPQGPETVELAGRAIAAHCQSNAVPLPSLALARLGPEGLELEFAGAALDAPVGFGASGRSWHLEQRDADYLTSLPGIDRAPMPYPALTTLGRDREGRQVLVDLEAVGLLALVSQDPAQAEAVLAAMATELAFAPWADELVLTLVGSSIGLPAVLGQPNVTQAGAVDDVLGRLERRARAQRDQGPHDVLGQHRLDPDLADPWVPEIVLVDQQLTEEQSRRLVALATSQPRVPLAVVVAGALATAPVVLELTTPPGGALTAVLQPPGVELEPQLLPPAASAAVVELVSATGSDSTTAAPWWAHEGEAVTTVDNVMQLGRRFDGWGASGADNAKETDTVAHEPQGESGPQVHHPILRLLGPVELAGASGSLPPRAGKQCLEYCGWLLEHPGTTAQAMASALVVAEGTRRSNMSRLRSWLGADPQGQAYLPDAYTGRILLHPSVSSDWQRLQILTAGGVNNTSSSGLQAALELVRGAPLADAAPGQWHWAEELRTDMISAVRDIGVELATRALADGDIDLARWSAARALVAAPGDELLMAVRIRTEHQAGHVAETERLTLQLAAQARALGVDLESETVTLLQEVMEGRVRARMA